MTQWRGQRIAAYLLAVERDELDLYHERQDVSKGKRRLMLPNGGKPPHGRSKEACLLKFVREWGRMYDDKAFLPHDVVMWWNRRYRRHGPPYASTVSKILSAKRDYYGVEIVSQRTHDKPYLFRVVSR